MRFRVTVHTGKGLTQFSAEKRIEVRDQSSDENGSDSIYIGSAVANRDRIQFRFPNRISAYLCLIFTLIVTSAAIAQESSDKVLSESNQEKIAGLVTAAIRDGQTPGAVVCIGNQKGTYFLKAFGDRQTQPDSETMTVDTVFDLASLTKPIATATSIMILVERGDIVLDQPAVNWLKDFGSNGKDKITVRHLLTHVSGLTPDNALKDYLDGPELAIDRINALKLRSEPGVKFSYSDVGFIVLAEMVREVTGKDVNEFSKENIFKPLGMVETGYLATDDLRTRAAATEQRTVDGKIAWMKGEVHDPRAYALNGVAGHAGLFSTAEDLSKLARMFLSGGTLDAEEILQSGTLELMTTPQKVSSGIRGLGWDMRTGYSSNRGKTMSDRAFGHGGFTGTSIWIDPELDLFVIFLSTRLHPDGKGSINKLAGAIGTIAADASIAK